MKAPTRLAGIPMETAAAGANTGTVTMDIAASN